MYQLKIAFLSTFLLSILKCSEAYIITVDARAEDCYHAKVDAGTKMGLMFEIVDGGFNDIDIKITDPQGKIIHEAERESSGKYTFGASSAGAYTYCFINQQGTMAPKTVMFNMEISETPKAVTGAANEEEGGHAKLEDMIRELAGTLTSIKHEQEYMNVRDTLHREINESTNSRVVLWSTFEALVLVLMTVGQVYYLKRFFEVRRVV